jgi:hypothetical protein
MGIDDTFAHWRRKGYPHPVFTDEQKLNELAGLLQYGAALVADGTVQQSMHGLSLAWSYHPHHINVRCAGKATVAEGWADDDTLRSVIRTRMEYSSVLKITASEMAKGIKSATGVQSPSNFRPSAANAIYEMFCPDGGTVFDPSCGYSGRLLGAWACKKVARYIGCDPCAPTFAGLSATADDLKRLRPDRKLDIEPYMLGSEDFKPAPGTVDCTLWSPPYFDLERYSDEPSQSCVRFRTRGAWLSGYFAATLGNVFASLKPGGILALNVSDAMLTDSTEALGAGFTFVRRMEYGLSRMIGSDQGEGLKTEPLLIFEKGEHQGR